MKRKRMATGGQAGAIETLGKQVPGLLDAILSLTNNNSYSKQPIVTAANVKSMATPYSFAMGGSIDDLDEDQLAELQAKADAVGMSIEDYMASMEEEDNGMEPDQEQDGDMPEEDDEEQEVIPDNEEEETFQGQLYALGGKVGRKVPIEVEDDEVIETPDGKIRQVNGKTHEEGGEDYNAPVGTKIYSDRLGVDGTSMQERKLLREKKISKLQKLQAKRPNDRLLKNTLSRTLEATEQEDQKDMAMQKIAGHLYAQPQHKAKYAGGGRVTAPINPIDPNNPITSTHGIMDFIQNLNAGLPFDNKTHPVGNVLDSVATNPARAVNPIPVAGRAPMTPIVSNPPTPKEEDEDTNTKYSFGIGDYVGMAGNLFNAIAPIVNTRNAARATQPNVNRFMGFGKDALDANENAQDYVAATRGRKASDISVNANTAYARNANSTTSVNTKRALDIATDMAKNKALGVADDSMAGQMIGLLDRRGGLENQQDMYQMRGAADKDARDKADTDNYFSNMAQNLVNAGTNIEGLGRNINTSKANSVNAKLASQLSKYLDIDANGNIKGKKKKRN